MLSLSNKLICIISLIYFLSACSHSESYSNSQAKIVDDDGQLIVDSLNMLLPTDTDNAICSSLQDPSKLPYISYGNANGFNACISRCLTYVLLQVCPQLPAGKNILATQPKILNDMLAKCNDDINSFVTREIQCPHVNCRQ
jgi:hypothetical protein